MSAAVDVPTPQVQKPSKYCKSDRLEELIVDVLSYSVVAHNLRSVDELVLQFQDLPEGCKGIHERVVLYTVDVNPLGGADDTTDVLAHRSRSCLRTSTSELPKMARTSVPSISLRT